MPKKLHDAITVSLSVLVGNALLAFLVAAFVIPHDIIMGGTTGIGIVLSETFSIDPALFILLLNVFFLILGGIVLGKKFFLTTVVSSVLYPAMLAVAQRIPDIDNMTNDPLLASVFAGILLGIALGLVLRVGASTGGVDGLNLILNKWFHIPVSICVYLVDFAIIGGQAIFSEPEAILYGILALVIETIVLDQMMLVGKSQIQILAISPKYNEIRNVILTELQAGATMLEIETGNLGEKQQGVLSVIPSRKLHDATELIQEIDPNVFMTVTQIKEVRGSGFTRERLAVKKNDNQSKE